MNLASKLKRFRCPKCNEEELYFWTKDETERHIEAYMNCDSCGNEFGKVVIQKSEDTSRKDVNQKLKKRHNIKEVN